MCWLDDVIFFVGYVSGVVEMWDVNRGSIVARFVGYECVVMVFELINNDFVKNVCMLVYVVLVFWDKMVCIWCLDDLFGCDCIILIGYEEFVIFFVIVLFINEFFSVGGDEICCWFCVLGYLLLYVLNIEYKVLVNLIFFVLDLSFMITVAIDGVMRLWVFTFENLIMV